MFLEYIKDGFDWEISYDGSRAAGNFFVLENYRSVHEIARNQVLLK